MANRFLLPIFRTFFLSTLVLWGLGVGTGPFSGSAALALTADDAAQSARTKDRPGSTTTPVEAQAEPRDKGKALAEVTGIHVVGSDNTVRLVLDVTRTVEPSSFLLGVPHRIVIDLADTALALKDNRGNGAPGFLKSMRYGTTSAGTLRFIIETDGPTVLERSFAVPAAEGSGVRVVFDIGKSDERAFRLAIASQAEEERLRTEEANRPAEKADLAVPPRRKRIVIDPGHGGKDGGAMTRDGREEKELVLDFSLDLASVLRRSGKYDVILTRSDDRFIPLGERVRIAREAQADLFISIHADSLPEDRRVRGTAVYTISETASDAMAARLAHQQNQADAIAGIELKNAPDAVVDILFDLTRREQSNLSILFARHFYESLRTKIQFFKEPLQRGAFTVLRVPDIPSALIELGFLSNDTDAELLASEEWREKATLDMASTIAAYFEKPLVGLNE